MKTSLRLMTIITTLMCSSVAFSVAKYGVVNMQKIIVSVQEGKSARTALEKEIKEKEKTLMEQKAELDKMNEEWKSQAALLSDDAKMKKQQEFQQKVMNLRNEEMKFQGEIKQKENEATQKIAIKVSQLVNDMAKDKKLEAIFEVNSSGLLYLQDPIDLTDEVIKAYDGKKK